MEYDPRTKTLMSQCEDGICVVELRNPDDGTVFHFEEPEFAEATGRKLHKVIIPLPLASKEQPVSSIEIVATDFAGNIYKGYY